MSDKYVKRISCGIDNCYVVRQGTHAILVDTCRRSNRTKILKAAKDEAVSLIVLTHGHYDHIANARVIAETLDIPIAMHSADVDMISDNKIQKMHANTLLGYLLLLFNKFFIPVNKIDQFYPDLFLQEGDSLKPFGIDAQIIELPGHTMGSIGLDIWGTDLIVGDACMPSCKDYRTTIYGNRRHMESSLHRVISIGKRTIHCGHGKTIFN